MGDFAEILQRLKKAHEALQAAIAADRDAWNYSLNEQTEAQNDAYSELMAALEEVV